MVKYLLIVLGFFLSLQQSNGQNSQVKVFVNGANQNYSLAPQGLASAYKVLKVITPEGIVSFSPTEIDGFEFENGKKYSSLKERNSGAKQFFQVLIEGAVSLGYYESNYYLMFDEEAVLLREDNRLARMEQSRREKRKSYLGVLHVALRGCTPDFIDKINSTSLSYPSLEKLLVSYHHCSGKNYEIIGEKEKYVDFGVSVAFGVSSFSDNMISNGTGDQRFAFRPEVLLTMDFNKLSPRMRAEVGVGFFSVRDSWIHAPELNPGGQRERYEEEFRIRNIQIPGYLTYRLIQRPKQDLYFGLGLSMNFLKKEMISEASEYEFMQDWEPYRVITRPRDPVLLVLDPIRFGGIVKLGFSKQINQKWSFFELHYESLPKIGTLDFEASDVRKYSMRGFSGKVGLRF
ncbi:hypothetical protein SAMN04488519_109110 [Algoriphagus ornithinivorans]|uniref:Outer membrane protein beta-barrel domain-containing protein n=1 Tax=Algoriphagus ornithinivorans TaxID=226506 RepID=A0A1I5IPG2_9BACT|nr:hypothetical protein [Algoriphagus ornithinivorans]SFO62407.1 hypothetical protein SAMN04488519_109110 [Algoriphagus ornithinivorans]